MHTEELDVLGEELIIHASKIVEADGTSLILRSEGSFILPPERKSSLLGLSHPPQHLRIHFQREINFIMRSLGYFAHI